jgi:hypothetical protein
LNKIDATTNIFAPGWISNVEYAWESPDYARFITHRASFSRFISPQAEYFSNMRGTQIVEAQQASSKAFAAMAQLMTGLSTLELAKGEDAKTHLSTAINTMKEAAAEFQALSEKNANLSLDVKFGDALTEGSLLTNAHRSA